MVWEFRTPDEPKEAWPFTAIRLPNGNTLVTCTHANMVLEVDPTGKTVWKLTNADLGRPLINDACGGTSATDRNLYVNSIGYDGTTYAGTTGALYSNTTSTFTVGGSTTTTTAPADLLTVTLSEDAYAGDAQFVLFLDGKQVTTAQSVTALNCNGDTQTFSFSGNFGAGSHTVGVQFTNDAYGGTSTTDRNMYVKALGLNGATVAGASANLYSAGTANFAISTLH